MFPLALCTDGGGSIRRRPRTPASWGSSPRGTRSRATADCRRCCSISRSSSPVARSVEDDEAVVRRDPRSRRTRPQLAPGVENRSRRDAGEDPRGGSVSRCTGRSRDHVELRGSASHVRALGHRIEEEQLPLSLDAIDAFWRLVGQVGLARAFDADPALRAARHRSTSTWPSKGRERAPRNSSRVWTRSRRSAAKRRAVRASRLVLTPTTAALRWPAEERFPPRSTDAAWAARPRGVHRLGQRVRPSGDQYDVGASREGLLIGVQIVGAFADDDGGARARARIRACRGLGAVAAALERHCGAADVLEFHLDRVARQRGNHSGQVPAVTKRSPARSS